MSRTNIDLDDEACRAVMERFQLADADFAVLARHTALMAHPASSS